MNDKPRNLTKVTKVISDIVAFNVLGYNVSDITVGNTERKKFYDDARGQREKII